MIVPPINSKGVFKFAPPFDTLVQSGQEYTVTAVRSLVELEASDENPYETIYYAIGLTELEFKTALEQDVPVVVFTTAGGEYFYVPADRILSEPITLGNKYREYTVMVSLGQFPVEYDFTLLFNNMSQLTYDTIGVTPDINKVPTSPITTIDDAQHNTFLALAGSRKTIDKSYKTKYQELLQLYEARGVLISNFEIMFRDNVCNKP